MMQSNRAILPTDYQNQRSAVNAYPPGTILPIPSRWQIKENWYQGDMRIKDEWGSDVFLAINSIGTRQRFGYRSTGYRLRFIDLRTDTVIAYISQHIRFCAMPKYSIFLGRNLVAEMAQICTCCADSFVINTVDGRPIRVSGDWLSHSYIFQSGQRTIATVSRRFFTRRDTYSVEIQPGENVLFILACCIVIDKCTTNS